MTSAKPATRITLAVILSLLIHGALLFGPNLVEIQPVESALPPLVARLEPLPKPAIPKPTKPKTPAKPRHESKAAIPAKPLPETVVVDQPDATALLNEPAAQPVVDIVTKNDVAPDITEPVKPAHPLPRQAELTFHVHKGTGIVIGEAKHRLQIDENQHYSLKMEISTIGVARFLKKFEMTQQSSGMHDSAGLNPDDFSESRATDKGDQKISARFDHVSKLLIFSNGISSALPDQAQDILSALYQFSQMQLNQSPLSMYISNGKKLERYEFEIGAEEEILTRKGKLRALPLHKVHAPGEEGLDIWLGLEYRLLPVKIRQIERNGEIAGEMVITDIRVSEE